jgi:hypothetical protein
MKRLLPLLACVVGVIVMIMLMPRFNAVQPAGIRLTRSDAVPIADRAARELGIPVEKAWATLSWSDSPLLNKEYDSDPSRRRAAQSDPAIAPRLTGYRRVYFRRGLEKNPSYGEVIVDPATGLVTSARLRRRPEEGGGKFSEAQLRPLADAFIRSHQVPGAPSPQYESARPTTYRLRTDWTFRYRVASRASTGNVVLYLWVFFTGDRFAGWALIEEYADGSAYRFDAGLGGVFIRYIANFTLLLIALIIFLRKYHAGEVGIGTGSVLLVVIALLSGWADILMGPSVTEGSNTGGLDAQITAIASMAFKFLLYDMLVAVLVFFAWSVGESYARERWGERLAPFDALLRRDFMNATVGRSLLSGVLYSPAVAAGGFLIALIPLLFHIATLDTGAGTDAEVQLGGPALLLVFAAYDAVAFSVIPLWLLAWSHRRRILPVGILAALTVAVIGGACSMPIDPLPIHLLFGFGGIAVAIAVFLASDLLTMAVALFGGSLLTLTAPLLSVAQGHEQRQLLIVTLVPLAILAVVGVLALLTKREIVYTYEDLAPHVKRIVERERVKAEIDAANRIQAALLPLDAPQLIGANIASHYRAASEIGGDYFDFLIQPNGDVGIAFGDVAGHGLTSGIVMSMAKAALLVQVGYDASPSAVLTVLNDIVMKVAPKRMMMTFFFGLLDAHSQHLRFSSAGHLDPYVYRAHSGKLEPLSFWGFPLGIRRREAFREMEVEFAPGDRLVLYSDGLIEAIDDDGEPFGFVRFEKAICDSGASSAEEIKKAILGAVRKFTRNRPPEDDQTLVVIGFEEHVNPAAFHPRATVSRTILTEPVN